MSKLATYDWANVKELECNRDSNPRLRLFEATCANGEVCRLMTGWPLIAGRDETIHCGTHMSMNECEGAFRLKLCLIDEQLKAGKLTLLGLTATGGSYNPGSLALDDEKMNPRLDERPIRVMR